MTQKRILTYTFATIAILLSLTYLTYRVTNDNNIRKVDFFYTYANKEEVLEYLDTRTNNFIWEKEEFGVNKLKKSDNRFTILKLNLDKKLSMDKTKTIKIRLRNKIAELYINGKLIQRNGEVGTSDIFTKLTKYYTINIPLGENYTGSQVIIVAESPYNGDSENIDVVQIVDDEDIFSTFGVYSLIILFFVYTAMFVAALACLNVYWMRYNFSGRLYRLIIPMGAGLFTIGLCIPFYPVKYPQYDNIISMMATICSSITVVGIINYAKTSVKNKYAIHVLNILFVTALVYITNMMLLIHLDKINWTFVMYTVEKIILVLFLPVSIVGFLNADRLDRIFVKPVKTFYLIGAATIIISQWMYIFVESASSMQALGFLILVLIINIIQFSSYTINIFHKRLFREINSNSSKGKVYEKIELARTYNVDTEHLDSEDFNNLDIEYTEKILQMDAKIISVILGYDEQSNDVNIIYHENNFNENQLTQTEARYYLEVYRQIFNDDVKYYRVVGNTAYLGFEENGLHYFMSIKTEEPIKDIRGKALYTYAVSVKSNASNYVITRLIERARNDVIKSFGKTIESRVQSNNVIDVTDVFVVFIARMLGKPENEVQNLKTASYIKNIGSITMSQEYLERFGEMDEEHLAEAYRRAEYGYHILEKFEDVVLEKSAIMSKYQFERFDGTGPLKIKGEDIPDEGKIIRLADAMTSTFRKSINYDNIFEEIVNHLETEYKGIVSPKLLQAVKDNRLLFEKTVGEKHMQFLVKTVTMRSEYQSTQII